MTPQAFQEKILQWYDLNGRKDLPWQQNPTAYRVWISEIMLQQTQVVTVIPYFKRFMRQFPDVHSLAAASLDSVLHSWSGLGYYARARNLHSAAQMINAGGGFPDTIDALTQLPGVGLSTAGAIMSIAFQQSHPILDGNVKRVLARFKSIQGWPGQSTVNRELWAVSKQYTPKGRVADYTQAMMDLGATICTRNRPQCTLCPVSQNCQALLENRTAELPTVKSKTPLTIRRCVFLILVNHDNEVFLEKRPASGIWGGLWCFPEFSDFAVAIDWCSGRGFKIIDQKNMPVLRHTFSHFHLDFLPLVIKTNNPVNFVMEANQAVWYKTGQIKTYGLPSPVRRLVEKIQQNEDSNGKKS